MIFKVISNKILLKYNVIFIIIKSNKRDMI